MSADQQEEGNMGRFMNIIMYLLWTLTIIMVLAATFTEFEYTDLNAIAVVLFLFSFLNSFLMITRKNK
ncbi:MAG: hypothetical protein ACLFPX_07430 [Candidatus Omnitrophota bacterium]